MYEIVIPTKVVRVEKRFRDIYISGYGKDAIFHPQDLGWWVLLEGSHEALYVGEEQPWFKEDDLLETVIRKRSNHALPS